MLAAIEGLIGELRTIGIPVSVSEQIDAVHGLTHVSLADYEEVKTALRAALVKEHQHEHAFDTVFDLFFATPGGDAGHPPAAGTGLADLDDRQIREPLIDALRAGDLTTVRFIAGLLVDRHARIVPGQPVAGTYYLFRTMRAIDQEEMLARLMPDEPLGPGPAGELGRRLAVEQAEARLDRLRAEVEAQIRQRLVADRGAQAVARTLRTPLPDDVDFLTASQQEIAVVRSTVQPLARKLASRLARKREHNRHGGLDFRRTVRRSMSTGGVPAEPIFRRPHPAKPELLVIADISGSVSTFATFTLQLVDALGSAFATVRTFVFVDGVDEVTDVFAKSSDIADAAARINTAASGVWLDGRSDYGNALQTFWTRWGRQLTSHSTVVVLGDARTNYHAPRAETLAVIRQRAGSVYWLNPEPTTAWDSGDSVMSAYARHCDGVFECRNVRQLKSFVDRLD
ncbi:VWA domain-containing protein [Acrocarpospora sp. B8E8]